MSKIDPQLIATAFVAPSTPSLAEVLEHVESAPGLPDTRRRDLSSGLRRVARAIGWPLTEIPADAAWLRPRLARIAPAAVGLKPKSWTNAVSDMRAALALMGVVERRRSASFPLSREWQVLWDRVLDEHDIALDQGLGRFVRFLSRLGVAPDTVTDAHLAAFRQALELNEIRKAPDAALRGAARAWNRAVERVPGWPGHCLTPPSSDHRYALPLEAFPAPFAVDLERYVEGMAHPDPLDPTARVAPLRPTTVRQRRGQVVRFASALVRTGMPIEEITDLSVLVANARRGLTWLLERNGGETSTGIAEHAIALAQLGRHHVHAPQPVMDELDRFVKRLSVPRAPGLTAKNRERLRPLQDRATLQALVRLPGNLAARAGGIGDRAAAAREMEVAVAIAILLTAPIRRKNLVELHLDRNLRRMRGGRACLVFEAAEVKNRRPVEIELPKTTIALIDRHLADHRPMLVPNGGPFLFPRRDGKAPMQASGLALKIRKTIRRETGLEINPHLFRHIAALVWLQANPGQYEVARRLLGHSELSSTLNAYAGFEAGTATRLFAELIEAAGKGGTDDTA